MDTDKHGWKKRCDRLAPGFGHTPNVESSLPPYRAGTQRAGLEAESKLPHSESVFMRAHPWLVRPVILCVWLARPDRPKEALRGPVAKPELQVVGELLLAIVGGLGGVFDSLSNRRPLLE